MPDINRRSNRPPAPQVGRALFAVGAPHQGDARAADDRNRMLGRRPG